MSGSSDYASAGNAPNDAYCGGGTGDSSSASQSPARTSPTRPPSSPDLNAAVTLDGDLGGKDAIVSLFGSSDGGELIGNIGGGLAGIDLLGSGNSYEPNAAMALDADLGSKDAASVSLLGCSDGGADISVGLDLPDPSGLLDGMGDCSLIG